MKEPSQSSGGRSWVKSESAPDQVSGALPKTARDHSAVYIAIGIIVVAIGAGMVHPGLGLVLAGSAMIYIGLFGTARKQ
jgi:hypothetical protein